MADGGGGAVTRAHRSQASHALCYVGKLDGHFLTSITSMIYVDDARHRVPMRVYVYVRGVIEQPVSPTTSGQFKPITAGPLRTGGRAAAANCSRASTSSLRTSDAGKPPHTHIHALYLLKPIRASISPRPRRLVPLLLQWWFEPHRPTVCAYVGRVGGICETRGGRTYGPVASDPLRAFPRCA